MASLTHKLFLDDSGNKEYSPDRAYSNHGGRTPYFVFGGLLLRPEVAGQLSCALEALKVGTFGTPDVELKAAWLKRDREREDRYIRPFNLDGVRLNAFVDSVYKLISETDCELIACVVNKAQVQNKYQGRAHYAPAIAYECVLQRAQNAMDECQGFFHVTIDDMDGKSPKGNEWKRNLIAQHRTLRKHGSRLLKPTLAIDRLLGDEPAFRDSAHDNRLQIADLVAHCVYRQFVDHGPDWEEPKGTELPTYEYLDRICHRFRSKNGRVQGYGIVKFPLYKAIPWRAK